MAGGRFVLPYQAVFLPIFGLPGAKLWFYVSGDDTPQDTFSNPGLTVANTNPVVADGGGRFGNIFMSGAAYKVVLTDSLDAEIWTADPVYGNGGGGSGGNTAARRIVTGNTVVTVNDQIIEVDATAGPVTVTYPLALGTIATVQPVTIVKIDATQNLVNIIDDGAATLRFSMAVPANGRLMQSAIVYSNGTALRVLNRG